METILVTGTHRSGSTWVSKVLSKAPRTTYVREPFNITFPRDKPDVLRYWYFYVTDKNSVDMGTYINDCISEAYFQSKKRIPRALANLVKPKNVILKDPIALLSADWVSRVFNGNMVVLIRHPAAFASSLKRMQWGFPFEHLLAQDELINHYFSAFHNKIEFYASTNQSIVNQAAFLWVLLHTVILHFKKEHPDWVYIRHEDISRKPVENFKTLFRKLGLRYTHHVDAYIRETTRDSNPAEANDNKAHQLQRNSKANVLNWKKRLTMEEIDVVRKITDEVAYRFYGADEW